MIATLTSVEVDYRGQPCLGPFDLAVAEGEVVALVGPSGCGKSTAMRLLAGLEQPTRGAVGRTAGRGETSLVFQAPTLAPWMSAAANVALPLELAGVDRREARDRAVEALGRVGLAASTETRPAQLSGGMAMRVSLARALVTRPRLLLLDEPFSALDAELRATLRDEFRQRIAQAGIATLLVTHDESEARAMAQHAWRLKAGQLEALW